MTIVVDASVTLSWLMADEKSPWTDEILKRVTQEGAVVPDLWRLEVANALRICVRRGRCDEPFADQCVIDLSGLPILVDPSTSQHAWGRTRSLSKAHGSTLCDAAYLELALRLGRPLASLDDELIVAARAEGVEVLEPPAG